MPLISIEPLFEIPVSARLLFERHSNGDSNRSFTSLSSLICTDFELALHCFTKRVGGVLLGLIGALLNEGF